MWYSKVANEECPLKDITSKTSSQPLKRIRPNNDALRMVFRGYLLNALLRIRSMGLSMHDTDCPRTDGFNADPKAEASHTNRCTWQ